MEKVYFNINQFVYVKLTEHGKEVFLKYANVVSIFLTGLREYKKIEDTWLEPEVDGYYKFQLWLLMQIFGSHIELGFSNCFDTDIYFNKRDLKEQSHREVE